MLQSAKKILGCTLAATDGHVGRCRDLLFDHPLWAIRYLVADTSWSVLGTRVLVSSAFLTELDRNNKILPVELTKKEIKNGPLLDDHAPISRQKEVEYCDYYDLPYYWDISNMNETYPTPESFTGAGSNEPLEKGVRSESPEDARLRSLKEVARYSIRALDADIGHIDDFIVDDEAWSVRYLAAETRNWLPGKKVLISTDWVGSVFWAERRVRVSLGADAIRTSPQYDPSIPIDRDYELRLQNHYRQSA